MFPNSQHASYLTKMASIIKVDKGDVLKIIKIHILISHISLAQ
jgi:hypothetical protein